MAKAGRKKGVKIKKLKVGESKVSSAFRIKEVERLAIIDKVRQIYGDRIGYTSLIPGALLEHLKITPEEIEARRLKFEKTGK